MIVGTPGGSRIITVVLHTILNVVDYGMDIQEAIDAPRIHQQWLPEATNVEPLALSPDTRRSCSAWATSSAQPQPENHVAAILIGAPALRARRSAGTVSTARTIRAATPGWRSVTDRHSSPRERTRTSRPPPATAQRPRRARR